MMRMILAMTVAVFAAVFCADLFAADRTEAKLAEAQKYLEQGEKLLFAARGKNPSSALNLFKRARAAMPKDADAPVLSAKISKATGLAMIACRKHKDAAAELAPLAKSYADASIQWQGKIWPQKPYSDWVEGLRKTRSLLEEGDLAKAAAEAERIEGEATANRAGKVHALVAAWLRGAALEGQKKYQDAADSYLRCAEAEVVRLEQKEQFDQRRKEEAAKREAGRVKTPDEKDIPKEEPPPGKLDGKYLKAVEAGLDWLVTFQKEDGSWDEKALEEMSKDDPLPPARTKLLATDQETALACMALLRSGVKEDGSDRGKALTRGLDWILANQSQSGRIPSRGGQQTVILAHAQYTWVLAEAALRIDDPGRVKPVLEKAAAFLVAAQNPNLGWRFGVRAGDNDTEHTGVCAIALARTRVAGVELPDETFKGALNWFDKATDEVGGRTGYAAKGDQGALRMDSRNFKSVDIATAMTLAARTLMGEDPKEGLLGRGFDTLWGSPPVWIPDKNINLSYGRYYTLAYALRPGADANYNLKRFADMITANQETKGKAAGSWPAVGALAADGRIAGTSRCILSIINARGFNLPVPMKPLGK